MKFISIAIDGVSGSGKSTIALKIAKKLNYQFVSTGYYYRLVAYFVCFKNLDLENKNSFDNFFKSFQCHFDAKGDIFIKEKNYTPLLFTSKVALTSSKIAKNPKLRKVLTKMQQELALRQNVVMEGRDITTIVLPQATYKFFITCDVKKRAQRRFLQLKARGQNKSLETIIKDIETRDYQDQNREVAPLIKSDDAILIDTTKQEVDETFNEMISHINLKKG